MAPHGGMSCESQMAWGCLKDFMIQIIVTILGTDGLNGLEHRTEMLFCQREWETSLDETN